MAQNLAAEVIGRAAKYDSQFSVPQLPVVRLGAGTAPHENGVLLRGVAKEQVLSGEFAKTHLARLLDLCDGTREQGALAAELGISEGAVFKALAFLWTCGMLEDNSRRTETAAVPAELATLLSRMGDSTGVRAHWSQAVAGLRSETVAVVGDEDLASALSELLEASCCMVVGEAELSDAGLIVLVERPGRTGTSPNAVGPTAWERGIPLVRVEISEDSVIIGPYVDPEFTPCLECAMAGLPERGSRNPGDSSVAFGLGLASNAIIAVLSRSLSTHLPGDSRFIELGSLKTSYIPSTTRAGCPRCGMADGPMAAAHCLAASYEQGVAVPPRKFIEVKGHQAHYSSSNLLLQGEAREFPSGLKVPLPDPDPGLLDRSPGVLNLETLGILLYYCAGLRPRDGEGSKLRRWTASGGNIGSVGARLIIWDVPGLLPGVYAYLESEHALYRLGSDPIDVGAPAALVLTGNVAKVAKKYSAFALRVTIQDGGCSAATAARVCAALGLTWEPMPKWDEMQLCSACGVLPTSEPITFVSLIGGPDA